MLHFEENTITLSGAVTAQTYLALLTSAAAYLGSADIIVDWSEVTEVDSSAVALILAWQRESNRQRVSLSNIHLPESLISLVELYSLTEILSSPGPA